MIFYRDLGSNQLLVQSHHVLQLHLQWHSPLRSRHQHLVLLQCTEPRHVSVAAPTSSTPAPSPGTPAQSETSTSCLVTATCSQSRGQSRFQSTGKCCSTWPMFPSPVQNYSSTSEMVLRTETRCSTLYTWIQTCQWLSAAQGTCPG